MDTTTIVGITGAVGTLVGVIATKGVDALLRLRKGKMEEDKQQHDQMSGTYERQIDRLTQRINYLETQIEKIEKSHREELRRVQGEHIECVKEQGSLRGRIEELEATLMKRISDEVIRLFRHDEANKANLAKLAEEVEKVKQTHSGDSGVLGKGGV